MADVPQQDRDLKLPRIQVGDRRYTKYDPNMALDIIERIADGELLKNICSRDAQPRMVAKSTFLRWVSTVPELAKAYAAATQISALSFEETALDRAERVANAPGTPANVSAASLYISQLRWSAARRNPTKYSDKGNTQIVVPVNINTTLDLGKGNGSIDVEVPDMYTFSLPKPEVQEAEYAEITDTSPREKPSEALATSTPPKREDLARILDTGPVVGVSHQPALQSGRKRIDNLPNVTGPRKRVLIPHNIKPHPNSRAGKLLKAKNNDPV